MDPPERAGSNPIKPNKQKKVLKTMSEMNFGNAPRVTREQIEENILAINYLNAGEAFAALGQPTVESHNLLTLCVIIMRNGFKVVGESACVYPENYDRDVGNKLAYENAISKIWPVMGYALADHRLYKGSTYWAQPSEGGE